MKSVTDRQSNGFQPVITCKKTDKNLHVRERASLSEAESDYYVLTNIHLGATDY